MNLGQFLRLIDFLSLSQLGRKDTGLIFEMFEPDFVVPFLVAKL